MTTVFGHLFIFFGVKEWWRKWGGDEGRCARLKTNCGLKRSQGRGGGGVGMYDAVWTLFTLHQCQRRAFCVVACRPGLFVSFPAVLFDDIMRLLCIWAVVDIFYLIKHGRCVARKCVWWVWMGVWKVLKVVWKEDELSKHNAPDIMCCCLSAFRRKNTSDPLWRGVYFLYIYVCARCMDPNSSRGQSERALAGVSFVSAFWCVFCI